MKTLGSAQWVGRCGALAMAALGALVGCGDSGGSGGSSSSTGGVTTGGATTGGAATGGSGTGASGTGAAPSTGGLASGGAAGAPAADAFWGGDYAPPATDGNRHHADLNCLGCHDGTETDAPLFAFAGTVDAPNVQIAVREGTTLLSAFSAADGTFYVLAAAGTVADWTAAEIRMRSANGEAAMDGAGAPGCNSCHTGSLGLSAP